jgi:hypothetical protein
MDSTHGPNWLGWFLYTIMVRDEGGSWLPCTHLLTQKEDSDIIAACLRLLRQWCGGSRGCRLHYFMTYDSATEQKAVKLAFRGLEAGETEVDHLLCRFNSEQTLKRKLLPSN